MGKLYLGDPPVEVEGTFDINLPGSFLADNTEIPYGVVNYQLKEISFIPTFKYLTTGYTNYTYKVIPDVFTRPKWEWIPDLNFRDWLPLRKHLPKLAAVWVNMCPYPYGKVPFHYLELGHTHRALNEVCLRDFSLLYDEDGKEPSAVMWHEYAHIIASGSGHGKPWLQALEDLGKKYVNVDIPFEIASGIDVQKFFVRKRNESC